MSRSEGRLNQYSSRGIGIPVAGAVGGGDDFAQRIAKPYVPKPFRSQGGFEGSADSTFSYKLARHQVNDREEAGLTFNFDSIADEKIAGPRRLSKNVKLRNLKKPDMKDFEQFGAKAIASVSMQYEQALLEYTETLLSRTEYDEDEELDEFSGAGAVAGYTIPLGAGPARKKDFYKKMAKPYGGTYVQSLDKIKPRP
jgi:hypothetical protein